MKQTPKILSPLRPVDCIAVLLCIAFILCCCGSVGRQGRILSQRMACRANLAVLGKSMAMYCTEYHDRFPQTCTSRYTNSLNDWTAPDRTSAFAKANGMGNTTISSHLYLLVRTMEVSPKTFLCYGEPNVTEFTLADHGVTPKDSPLTLSDVWDFGDANTMEHCSYAYHYPFTASYALTTDSNPRMAVTADRNPWCQDRSDRTPGQWWQDFIPDISPIDTSDHARVGNSDAHGLEGQNVLYVDGHINFETRSYCASDQDNIYTTSFVFSKDGEYLKYTGIFPFFPSDNFGFHRPSNNVDSLLLNDIENYTPSTNQ